VRAVAVYLAVHQHLPYDRMARLFSDVLSAPVSTGALASMVAECAKGLDGFEEIVRGRLAASPVAHFDETGARVGGRPHWVHSASGASLTLIGCHPRRGAEAMDDMGVLPAFSGVAVHDGWKPCRAYGAAHGLCNAHHLRELAGVGEVWNQGWAEDLAGLLIEAKVAVDAARAKGAGRLEEALLHSIRTRYGRIISAGHLANPAPPPGRRRWPLEARSANLVARLDSQRADALRFCADFSAPFDNNQAERDLRMVKLQQKISARWRTLAGAKAFCVIRSYISTARKQRQDVLAALRQVFEGHPWLPEAAPT
jgi:hypothetical protein